MDSQETLNRYTVGKELRTKGSNLNCGNFEFKSCNEFIRAGLYRKMNKNKYPHLKEDGK